MGLARKLYNVMDLAFMAFDRPVRYPVMGHGELIDEGPDDLWPAEPTEETLATVAEPETIVGYQWGLKLPSGEVSWSMYQGTPLNSPIDRVQMIARIKKTALDAGFGEAQLGDFLANYGWEVRKQIAVVTYEEVAAYELTDSGVSAPEGVSSTPSAVEDIGTNSR